MREAIPPPRDLYILDQGQEGACTGFGLAATINLLYCFQHKEHKVSPRMLYELARRYDEWPGEDYEGSSCRGAINGRLGGAAGLADPADLYRARG